MDVTKFAVDIFRTVEWSFKVEVGDIEAGEFGTWPGDNTVELQLHEIQGPSWGADIARVAYTNTIAPNDDASTVGISLLRADSTDTDDFGEGDLFSALDRNLGIVNNTEGIGTGYTLAMFGGGAATNALAETS